jgi:hypothetical protein
MEEAKCLGKGPIDIQYISYLKIKKRNDNLRQLTGALTTGKVARELRETVRMKARKMVEPGIAESVALQIDLEEADKEILESDSVEPSIVL